MALIYEHSAENAGIGDKYVMALDKWKQLRNEQACRKTVEILKKSAITKRELIYDYARWVLECQPEIGLSLFYDNKKPLTD